MPGKFPHIRKTLSCLVIGLLFSSIVIGGVHVRVGRVPQDEKSKKIEKSSGELNPKDDALSHDPSPQLRSEEMDAVLERGAYGTDKTLRQLLEASKIHTAGLGLWLKKTEELSIAATTVEPLPEHGLNNSTILLSLSLKDNLYPLLVDLEDDRSNPRVQAVGSLRAWKLHRVDEGPRMVPISPLILSDNMVGTSEEELIPQGILDVIGCILGKIFNADNICKYLTCVTSSSGAGFLGCLVVFIPGGCDLSTIGDLLNCVAGSPPPTPTLNISPSEQAAGQAWQYNGLNYSANGPVSILLYRQGGGSTRPISFTTFADSSGSVRGSFTPSTSTAAGTYAVIAQDSNNGYSKAVTIVVDPPASGAGLGTCANPYNIGPGTYSGNTAGGQSIFDFYNCTNWREDGPERVYRITLSSPGTLTATLSDISDRGSDDLDVFILSTCDPNICLAYGDLSASANLGTGTYYIVVDGYHGAVSSYTLRVSVSGGPRTSNLRISFDQNPTPPLSTPCTGGHPTPQWHSNNTITETAGVGIRVTQFTFDFYDADGNFLATQTNTGEDFANWTGCGSFDPIGNSHLSGSSSVCMDVCWWLGGRTAGSVILTFRGIDDNGNSLNFTSARLILQGVTSVASQIGRRVSVSAPTASPPRRRLGGT